MVHSCEDCAMHATFIRNPAPDAERRAGCLSEALNAPLIAAAPLPDAADIAPAKQQFKIAIILEALAALAMASGGYAG
jgi:hypothetical protein